MGILLKAGEILGGAGVTASCKSQPRINGKNRFVQLAGLAGGMSVGIPFESSYTDLTLENNAATPLASSLSPYFSLKSLGLSIFMGFSVETDVTFGSAHGKTDGFGWGGLSAGFDALVGATTVILDMEGCCK